MHDLIVIGGGPAGTSAAITAARSGASVLLAERGKFPRHKVCGEFVSAESLELLRSLLAPRFEPLLQAAPLISQARIFLDGHMLRAPVDPPAASIARFGLDQALWNSAKENGVDARPEVAVLSIAGKGPFRVMTSTAEFEGRAVVNASGRWSNLNSRSHDSVPREKWLGLKAHFAEPQTQASVDLYFFDGGYCGVQPVALQGTQTTINVCAMVRADAATTLQEVFAVHPALAEQARFWQPVTEPVSTSPLIFRPPLPAKENVLNAGDAAGFIDPFVGDGISLALRSGALAARMLGPYFSGAASLDQTVCEYGRAYGHSLLPVFRNSSRLRQAFRLPRMVRLPILSILAMNCALTRRLVRSTR